MTIRQLLRNLLNTTSREPDELTYEEVQRIVSSYGAVLENSSAMVSDISLLPYPKEKIKAAMLIAIGLTSEPNMRQHLKNGYVALADYQTLSTDEKASVDAWNSIHAGQIPNVGSDDLLKTAQKISMQGKAGIEAQKRATEEAVKLSEELRAAGF